MPLIEYYKELPDFFRVDSLNLVMNDVPLDKADFLALIGKKLEFPSWYGQNWDALDDCLCDLPIHHPHTIRLVFPCIPLKQDVDMHIFLEIATHAQETLAPEGIALELMFLCQDRDRIESIMRES